MLRKLFSGIKPEKYNLLNRVLTLFYDILWRREVTDELISENSGNVLDLCCGTGDLAFLIANKLSKRGKDTTMIMALDFCDSFLQYARNKAVRKRLRIKWIEGDVANLPFADGSIDCIGVAFSFRNLIYRNPQSGLHLEEIARVLRRKGKLVIVETAQPSNFFIRILFHLYLEVFVSYAGGLISGNRQAYRYLAESARNFIDSEGAKALFLRLGFGEVRIKNFLFGAICLYIVKR